MPADADDTNPKELHCLGGVNDLSALLIRRPIHEVIAVHSAAQSPWLSEVLTACDQAAVPVHVVDGPLLEASTDTLRPLGPAGPFGLPIVTLGSRHADLEALFLKPALDILVSAALLLLLSPLLAVIALLVQVTSGSRRKASSHVTSSGRSASSAFGRVFTCLWQVRGRNAISDFDDWVRMDLEHIDKWSLWLDLKILAWTALAVARGTGR